jgi:methyl-accepting chemotaxis protein
MKLSIKLIGGFVTVAVITLAVGVTGWLGVRQMGESLRQTAQMDDIAKNLLQREIDHLNWVQKAGAFQSDETITELNVEKDSHKCGFGAWYYSDARKQAETYLPEIAAALSQIQEPHNKLHQSAVELETLLKKGKDARKDAMDYYRLQVVGHLQQVKTHLAEIRSKVQEHTQTAKESVAHQEKRTTWAVVGGMIVGTLVALAVGIVLCQSLIRSITQIAHSLSTAADQTATASGQVSAASQSLAEGASEQAASLEETSSSLEEMSSMTKRNAENAQKTKDLAGQARSAADTGASDMEEMSGAMGDIKAASDGIAKIIKTIDEIAFQTNILALNAAVEAARAGEAGMGFAVVADEVRNLAQRSAQAAKETAAKIEDSITKSEKGVHISEKVGQSLKEIVSKVRRVDELVGEIAAASQEQSQGIEQVNTAVSQMDKVTQTTAATAEESASAAEELNAQADALKEAVVELQQIVNGANASQTGQPISSAREGARRTIPASPTKIPSSSPANGNGQTVRSPKNKLDLITANTRKADVGAKHDDFRDF